MFQARPLLLIFTIICLIHAFGTSLSAEEPAFYPNWKLLKQQEKTQFIAGYLQAWQDAHKIIGVLSDYVKENPDSANESLERIVKIYDFSTLRPDSIVREMDAYFSDSKNHKSSLAQAVTAARGHLR